MIKGFVGIGVVIGLFVYITMYQNFGGSPPIEGVIVELGILLLAGLSLPIIVIIVVATSRVRSAKDTLAEAKRLLK